MKKEDELKNIHSNMINEFHIDHRKITRLINSTFNEEIYHFKELLIAFNDEYKCIGTSEIDKNVDIIKDIFNSSRAILVKDYDKTFSNNVEELTDVMYQFYLKKLNNPNARCPSKEINTKLKAICKFDCFLIENELEDKLLDYASEFAYKYINNETAYSDFYRLIKSVKYTLICDLKKAISNSIDDKEDITTRYNTEFKKVLIKRNK